MTTVKDIYQGAENLINQLIRKESIAQGHFLAGKMDESFAAKVKHSGKSDTMEGFGVFYTQFVNDGVPAASASMKQFPFMVRYFQQRGLGEKEAKGAAAATIKVWMKEGMSTQASKRFSETGARQNMVEAAFVGGSVQIDDFMGNALDFAIEENFHSISKSERI